MCSIIKTDQKIKMVPNLSYAYTDGSQVGHVAGMLSAIERLVFRQLFVVVP